MGQSLDRILAISRCGATWSRISSIRRFGSAVSASISRPFIVYLCRDPFRYEECDLLPQTTTPHRNRECLLNTLMKNQNPNTYRQAVRAIDNQLLEDLTSLGIVSGPVTLSTSMGRNRTYWSCMRNREYGLNVGSLVLLHVRLSNALVASDQVRERARYRAALEVVNRAVNEKCRIREQELLAQR